MPATARLAGLYWGGAMVGRFGGSLLLRRLPSALLLAVMAAIAGTLIAVSITTSGYTSKALDGQRVAG